MLSLCVDSQCHLQLWFLEAAGALWKREGLKTTKMQRAVQVHNTCNVVPVCSSFSCQDVVENQNEMPEAMKLLRL